MKINIFFAAMLLSSLPLLAGTDDGLSLSGTTIRIQQAALSGSTAATELLAKAGLDVPQKEIPSVDFTLDSLDGKKVSLSSYKGSLVFLSFWATWCPPCRKEMPGLQALYEKLKAKGLVIVAVDLAEYKKVVSDFIKKNGYTFPVLLDSTGAIGGGYGAQSIPTNYIIDRKGNIIARKVGIDGVEWNSAQRVSLFEKLLAQ
jgi:thiol-disulfide isomerase/thioredoxin